MFAVETAAIVCRWHRHLWFASGKQKGCEDITFGRGARSSEIQDWSTSWPPVISKPVPSAFALS